MDERTFCPLSMSGPADMDLMRCIKEECGWWDEEAQTCAVMSVARAVRKVMKNAR